MKKSNLFVAAVLAAFCIVSQGFSQQEGQGQPEIQLKPKQVVQEPDAKSLIEKASFLIGFNFMSSAKNQPGADMEQIFEGMKAAASGQDRTSFIAGYQMMERIKKEGVDLNLAQIQSGMVQAAGDKELGMSDEEVNMLMTAFSKMVQNKKMEQKKAESKTNLAAGEAYIAAQKKDKPNLKQLENGCYYEILNPGSGATPKATDTVRVDYTGRFIDGEVFDSSLTPRGGRPAEPAEFQVSGVVPGFSETLQNMKVGGKWRVIIPGPLAYGVQGRGSIGPNQMLIFEISLLEIVE